MLRLARTHETLTRFVKILAKIEGMRHTHKGGANNLLMSEKVQFIILFDCMLSAECKMQ